MKINIKFERTLRTNGRSLVVAIPKEIQDYLELTKGDKLELDINEYDEIVIKKVNGEV